MAAPISKPCPKPAGAVTGEEYCSATRALLRPALENDCGPDVIMTVHAWAAALCAHRLLGAVPVVCGPGDVYIQNRMVLHCAFANQSAAPRMTIQWGFNRREAVLGKTTMGYGGAGGSHAQLITYYLRFS